MDLEERLRGGLLGLLVGDALGVPYEFRSPDRIPALAHIEMEPPPGYARAHDGVPPATWSDDGAQALCLLASLLHADRLDLPDLGRRLVNWLRVGYMAVDYDVFDVGGTTHAAIVGLEGGMPADQAGPEDEHSNGNGSLMRVLPLALWHTGSDEELVRDARQQSLVTHGHVRSQLACALYCLWARGELADQDDAWDRAVANLRKIIGTQELAVDELEREVLAFRNVGGTGYVVDCLQSARASCQANSYEATVREAIALGHDTDTTACVAGGIAGIRHGVHGIPERWRKALRGQDLVEPLLAGLLKRRGF